MLRVLSHYLPVRQALLVVSEVLLLTAVVMAGMSAHLWAGDTQLGDAVTRTLALEGLSRSAALGRCLMSSVMVALLAQVAISFNERYDFRVVTSRYERASRFLGTAGSAIFLALGAVVLAELWHLERFFDFPGLPVVKRVVVLTFSLTVGFVVLYFWVNLFHVLLHRFGSNERLLIVGSGRAAEVLAEEVRTRMYSGYEIAGVLASLPPGGEGERRGAERAAERAAEHAAPGPRATTLRVAGGTALRASPLEALGSEPLATPAAAEERHEPLEDTVRRLRVDTVVVAIEDRRGAVPTEELLSCRLQGTNVVEYESIYERITGKIAVAALRPSYLIFNPGFVQLPHRRAAKRALDLVLAALILFLTWPVMLVAALLVRLDSPGPVLFKQERVGRGGHPFILLKFRSMRADAERATGPVWASQDDPRITRVGRFLRRTRLDELPQLFNVLAGSMSMVGPRPERPHFVEDLAEQIPFYPQRHAVKPGLTGWAQINYPYGNTVEDALQKLQYDLFYIKHHSLIYDLSILLNTIKIVVLRRGT